MYVLRSEREDNHMLKAVPRALIVSAFVLHLLLRVWTAKTQRPMADDAITRGGIGSLVSLVYICGDYIYCNFDLFLLQLRQDVADDKVLFGCLDTWLVWKLTKGNDTVILLPSPLLLLLLFYVALVFIQIHEAQCQNVPKV